MSKHTPEPWRVSEASEWAIAYEGSTLLIVDAGGFRSRTAARQTRDDVVAALNACAGINPAGVPEIVEVLEEAVELLGDFIAEYKCPDSSYPAKMWSRARATLAKARP